MQKVSFFRNENMLEARHVAREIKNQSVQVANISYYNIFNRNKIGVSMGMNRKPLRILTQQENNPVVQNNNNLAAQTKNTVKTESKYTSTPSSRQQLKKKPISTSQKKTKYEGGQRQGQNCQNYFLRKTIMTLYRFFERTQTQWDLENLTFGKLLCMLQQLGYARGTGQQEMRRVYWLWLNLCDGRYFSLRNLLVVLSCLQQLDYDQYLIAEVVAELAKGISKFKIDQTPDQHPPFIFLARKEGFSFQQGALKLDQKQAEKIRTQLKELRLNKLMQGTSVQGEREEVRGTMLSKRSHALANQRRQQMAREIKQREPYVQEIMLHHLLSYRPNNCKQKMKPEPSSHYHSYLLEEVARPKSKEIPVVLPCSLIKTQLLPSSGNTDFEAEQVHMNQQGPKESFQLQPELLFEGESSSRQIVDELQWEEIPRGQQEVRMERQLAKELFFQQPLSMERERKRKEWLDLPMLFVDVNIEEGRKERIVIYEGDQAAHLAEQFGRKHGLKQQMVQRLQGLLEMQIASILTKIQEANEEQSSELY